MQHTQAAQYLPGEALTGSFSALEWMTRFEPHVVELLESPAKGAAELTATCDRVAVELNLGKAADGRYPPVLWEMAAGRAN